MKSFKKFSVLLCLLIVCSILFTACGEKKSESTKDESSPDETTVVLETTSDGGTIEQDSEENKITKDKDGKVIYVEDKDGNPIDVTEYLSTHSWVESNDDSSSGSGSSGGGSGSSGGGSDSSGGESDSSGGGSGGSKSSSDLNDTTIEESIPVVVVTIPDDDDVNNLPEL